MDFFSKREEAKHQQQRPTEAQHLVGGTTAGVVTTTALYPLDLVKTRYQARKCDSGGGRETSSIPFCTPTSHKRDLSARGLLVFPKLMFRDRLPVGYKTSSRCAVHQPAPIPSASLPDE